MAEDSPRDADFGVADIVKALRRRWWIVALCAVVTPAAALVFSLTQEKLYSAEATLLFQETTTADTVFGVQDFNADRERTAATNTGLAALETLYDRTERALASRVSSPRVDVTVEQSGVDDLAQVVATDPNPRVAALTATVFAEQFVAFRRESDRREIERTLGLLGRRIERLREQKASKAAIDRLVGQEQALQNLLALRTGNVALVQRARVPDAPSSPRTRRNIALGIILGGLLGLALALLIDRLDRRIRAESEIPDSLDAPVLGAIPHSKAIAKQKGGLEQLKPTDVEAFRLLRAELRYFEASKNASCVLVTSSTPTEGKSTVSWNLALTAAEAGARTLLIEADLRRPVLALRHGATPGEHGLSTVLSKQSTLKEAVVGYERSDSSGEHHFDVLYAGPKPPNPGDLLEGENMRALLVDMRAQYDYVVIDAAPVSVVSDPIPLLSQVDGVLVVTRLGVTRRDGLAHLRVQLAKFRAPVLGVVINAGGRLGEYSDYGLYAYAGYSQSPSQPIVARGASTVSDADPVDAADFMRTRAAGSAQADSKSRSEET